MKNISKLLGAVMLVFAPALLFAQSGTYTINGKIGQLSAPAKAYLSYYNGTATQTDSTLITNGTFTFKGIIDQPLRSYLVINKKGTGTQVAGVSFIMVYLEPATINIESPDSLDNARFSGGPINAENQGLKASLKPITKKMDALNNVYSAASEEEKKSKQFTDSLQSVYASLANEQQTRLLSFYKTHPDSWVSFYLLRDNVGGSLDIAALEPLFNSLSANIKTSKPGSAYADEIAKMKKTGIGAVAPDFTQTDTSGKAISLHDFKGKYVLVDFWASWCGPCRAENPNVVKAYEKYKNKNFSILGVSLDATTTKSAWTKAINDDHLTWTEVSDLKGWKNEAAQLYMVNEIPQNFLVGPDGKIVGKNLRGEDLEKKLAELLK